MVVSNISPVSKLSQVQSLSREPPIITRLHSIVRLLFMGIPEYPLHADNMVNYILYIDIKTQQTFDIQDLDDYRMLDHVVAKK